MRACGVKYIHFDFTVETRSNFLGDCISITNIGFLLSKMFLISYNRSIFFSKNYFSSRGVRRAPTLWGVPICGMLCENGGEGGVPGSHGNFPEFLRVHLTLPFQISSKQQDLNSRHRPFCWYDIHIRRYACKRDKLRRRLGRLSVSATIWAIRTWLSLVRWQALPQTRGYTWYILALRISDLGQRLMGL